MNSLVHSPPCKVRAVVSLIVWWDDAWWDDVWWGTEMLRAAQKGTRFSSQAQVTGTETSKNFCLLKMLIVSHTTVQNIKNGTKFKLIKNTPQTPYH